MYTQTKRNKLNVCLTFYAILPFLTHFFKIYSGSNTSNIDVLSGYNFNLLNALE